MQLFTLSIFIFVLACVGVFYPYNRGGLFTALIVLYALTASISGYMAASYYTQMEGTQWVRNILLTCITFCGPLFLMFCFNNTVAIVYRVSHASCTTMSSCSLPSPVTALQEVEGCLCGCTTASTSALLYELFYCLLILHHACLHVCTSQLIAHPPCCMIAPGVAAVQLVIGVRCNIVLLDLLHHMVCCTVQCWLMPCHLFTLKHLRRFSGFDVVHTSTAFWNHHGDLGHLGSGHHPSLHSGWHHGQEQQVHLLMAKMAFCKPEGSCSPLPVVGLHQSHAVCMTAV